MLQDIHEQSAIQRYPIGFKYPISDPVDLRGFHYSKSAHAIGNVGTYRLAVMTDQILENNDRRSVAPAAAAGDKTVKVDVTVGFAPNFLAFQGGVVAVDELIGGYVEIWPVAGGSQFMWRRIVHNTAVSGGNIIITVDKPFNFAVGIDSQVTIHPSIYRAVKSAGDAGLTNYQVAVGLPPIPVDNGNFFWLQTWGRCFVAPTGDWPLAIANFVDVYMHSDGCIHSSKGESIGTSNSPQRVGYALGAGLYGSGEIMLQLDP
jgi:hypothetical protein